MDGSRQGPRIELGSGDARVVFPVVLRETLIGRIDSNHVVLDHQSVSRIHARLHLVGERVELEDCGSSLGSQVNGELIEGQPNYALTQQGQWAIFIWNPPAGANPGFWEVFGGQIA